MGNFPETSANFPWNQETELVHTLIPNPMADRGGEIMFRQFRFTLKVQGLQWGRGEYLKTKSRFVEMMNGC